MNMIKSLLKNFVAAIYSVVNPCQRYGDWLPVAACSSIPQENNKPDMRKCSGKQTKQSAGL